MLCDRGSGRGSNDRVVTGHLRPRNSEDMLGTSCLTDLQAQIHKFAGKGKRHFSHIQKGRQTDSVILHTEGAKQELQWGGSTGKVRVTGTHMECKHQSNADRAQKKCLKEARLWSSNSAVLGRTASLQQTFKIFLARGLNGSM